MFEICSGRKIISGAGLWLKSNSKMGIETKVDQYGEGSEESERKSVEKTPRSKYQEPNKIQIKI